MALYQFKCKKCENFIRIIRPKRPELGPCEKCGGEQEFVTNGSMMVKERRDNGFMPRVVEQLKDVDQLMADRAEEKPEPEII